MRVIHVHPGHPCCFEPNPQFQTIVIETDTWNDLIPAFDDLRAQGWGLLDRRG